MILAALGLLWVFFGLCAAVIYPTLLGEELNRAWGRRRWGLCVAAGVLGEAMILLAVMVYQNGEIRSLAEVVERTTGALSDRATELINGVQLAAMGLAAVFVAGLAGKWWGKWIGGHLSDAERSPTARGGQAWLSTANLVCAAGAVLCVWVGWGTDAMEITLVIVVGGLVAYPLMQTLQPASAPAAPAIPAAAPEVLPSPVTATPSTVTSRAAATHIAGDVSVLDSQRDRVLRLLEEGKISAKECADLLAVLNQSSSPVPQA